MQFFKPQANLSFNAGLCVSHIIMVRTVRTEFPLLRLIPDVPGKDLEKGSITLVIEQQIRSEMCHGKGHCIKLKVYEIN